MTHARACVCNLSLAGTHLYRSSTHARTGCAALVASTGALIYFPYHMQQTMHLAGAGIIAPLALDAIYEGWFFFIF